MQTKITLLRRWRSLRLALLALLLTTSTLITRAQAPNAYSFSSSTNTYTPITGGTVLGTATNDDNNFNALPIGFTFTYNGIQFTTASVNANGFLALGSTVISSYTSISSGTSNNVIAALNNDLQGLATVGNLRYQTTGTSPNQVFVVQWSNYKRWGSANNSDTFNFQIRLSEASNLIEIVYGNNVITPSANVGFQVGLRGSSNASFFNRTSATSWTSTTSGTTNTATVSMSSTNRPSSGLTFTFTPPPPVAPTVFTGTKTNITSSTVTLAGTIAPNSNPPVTASGIVVGTTPNPTVGGVGVIDSATNPVVTSGSFTLNIDGLQNGTTYYYRAYATNAVGTSYGPDSTFTTNASASLPAVNRIAASAITGFTASIGGNIANNGGDPVTASGVVFSTSPNPTLFGSGVVDSTTTPVVAIGNFNFNLVGLSHSTKYYYRAYATNSLGTAYSIEDSFTTAPVISVLPYTENFDLPGNNGWSSTTVNAGTNTWQLGTPAKTNLNGAFSGNNAWVTSLTGSYAGGNDCAVVSPQMDFSTLTATPILRFKHEMDVDADLGWDGGVVEISINGGTWTRLDAVTGTAPTYNTANSTAWYNDAGFGPLGSPKWSVNTTTYPGHLNGWITSTTPLTGAAGQSNVRIRFRFAADGIVDEGWAIDNIEVFEPSAPTVLTGTNANVTTSNATLAGNITNNGGNAVTASGVVISASPNPTRGAFGVVDSASTPLTATGAFTVNITGLTAATTYYYRAYAVNSIGTSYGADSVFTTPASAIIPTVQRVLATNVTTTTATFGGNITSDGGSVVTASGVVYSTTPNPTLFGTGVVDVATSPTVLSGTYTVNATGLTHSTKYYFRSYASNAVGTGYSLEDSFVTSPIITTLPYAQDFEGNVGGWSSALTSTNPSVNWVIGVVANNNWALGTPSKTYLNGARSGTKAWATKLTGDYDIDHDASLVSPQFNLTAISTDPIVRFYHKFRSESEWDGMIIEQSINGGFWTRVDSTVGIGTNYNTTNSYAWYNDNVNNVPNGGIMSPPYFSSDIGSGSVYASQNSGWVQSAFRLVGASGQSNVRFRFRFISDTYVTDEGWAIDDIEVVEVATPTTAASNVTVNPSATSATVNFTAGNGQGRMVVARLLSTLAVAPSNNTIYNASAVFGSTNTTGTGNFIVYMGNGTSVNVTGLTQLTDYAFDVYEYNGKYMHINFAGAISSNTTTTPVKLVSLKATKVNDDVLVSWSTASEVNNRGFNVERSIDGKTFEYVGFVKGAGNSSVTNNYRLQDANAFVSTGVSKLYYRLKQMDNDGKFEYSKVVTVENNERKAETVITYPNPFSDKITVALQHVNAGLVKVEVLDLSGRLVSTTEMNVTQGNQTLTVEGLSNLTQGVYFVRVRTSDLVITNKLVKQ